MIKDWYKDLSTHVRIGSQLSKLFPIERGIRLTRLSVVSCSIQSGDGPTVDGGEVKEAWP